MVSVDNSPRMHMLLFRRAAMLQEEQGAHREDSTTVGSACGLKRTMRRMRRRLVK